jgi:pimeloyl-ACP methyl ester carboxylesterase
MGRLLVPGTGGCTYSTADGEQLGTMCDIALGHADHLLCSHAPGQLEPVTTSGVAGASIHATGVHRAAYQPFLDLKFPKYDVFKYDWRLDIRYSGQLLLEFLVDHHGAEEWDIVCHSQGGLVLLWAAKLAEEHRLKIEEFVRRVVLVGVPTYGTINAAAAILQGVDAMPGAHVPARVVRTWPAIYMSMPVWDVGFPPAGAQLYLDSTWNGAGLLPPLGQPPDFAKHVDPSLLERAREWRNSRANMWFHPLKGIDGLLIIQGNNIATRASAPQFPDLPDGPINGTAIVRGDSLVPADLTFKLMPTWAQQEASTMYLSVKTHMFMCNEPSMVQLCETYFNQ